MLCARALQRVPPRRRRGSSSGPARGRGPRGPPAKSVRPASQGQESLEIRETENAWVFGTEGSGRQLSALRFLRVQIRGQAVDSAGGDRVCPACGTSAARGGACTRFGEIESPAAIHSAAQESPLCPHCVPPTVLRRQDRQRTLASPSLAPQAGWPCEEWRKRSLSVSTTLSEISQSRAESKNHKDDVCNTWKEPEEWLSAGSCSACPYPGW